MGREPVVESEGGMRSGEETPIGEGGCGEEGAPGKEGLAERERPAFTPPAEGLEPGHPPQILTLALWRLEPSVCPWGQLVAPPQPYTERGSRSAFQPAGRLPACPSDPNPGQSSPRAHSLASPMTMETVTGEQNAWMIASETSP